jgi:L-threonylcarbamoyladenylate synthase
MKRINIHNLLSDKITLNCFCNDIENGAVAVIPTDTLYGFAVSFNSKVAIEKVYKIKNRDARKPLILFVTNVKELEKLGLNTSNKNKETINKNWPGGLTAILQKPESGELSNFSFPTIGVRAPNHQGLLNLLEILPVKLLTTSANRSGKPSDTNPDNIAEEFEKEVDWFIDDGILPCGVASTVVDFTRDSPKILRQGKVMI